MPDEGIEKTVWWGTFPFEVGQAGCWHIGPSTVRVFRLPFEWRLVHREDSSDPMSEVARLRMPLPADEVQASLESVPDGATVSRFGFRKPSAELTVTPMLADRPVVVRPETPLYLPEGEAVTLYVSTALWLRFAAGTPVQTLTEVASFRPSDTWYGTTTYEGELCYATRSLARLNLADLPPRLHRAITPVRVRNHTRDALLVEHLQLPIPYLALYQAEAYLWTPRVTLTREKEGAMAALHLAKEPPPEAEAAQLVAEARQTSHSSLLGRTFSTIFHKMREA